MRKHLYIKNLHETVESNCNLKIYAMASISSDINAIIKQNSIINQSYYLIESLLNDIENKKGWMTEETIESYKSLLNKEYETIDNNLQLRDGIIKSLNKHIK